MEQTVPPVPLDRLEQPDPPVLAQMDLPVPPVPLDRLEQLDPLDPPDPLGLLRNSPHQI